MQLAIVLRSLTGFALLEMAFLTSSCGSSASVERTVKIGVIAPLTGDSSDIGKQAREGAQLAEKEVNSLGAANGKQLKVVIEDSQGDAQQAVLAMRKLVSIDHVPAVIGDFRSKSILAEAAIANENHVVLIGPTTSAPAITTAGPYVNRLWPVDKFEASRFADWCAANNIRSVAILYINDDYGLGLRDAFTSRFKSAGGQITNAIGFGESETDFKPALSKLAGGKPDAIYIVGFYKNSAIAVRQAREAGISAKLLGTTACEDEKFLEIAGKDAEGFLYPIVTGFDPVDPTPEAAAFIGAFRKEYGSDPNWAGAHYYEGVRLIAHLMSTAGTDGPALQKALLEVHDYRGATGVVNFDQNGDVVGKPLSIKTVKDGRFTVVAKLQPQTLP